MLLVVYLLLIKLIAMMTAAGVLGSQLCRSARLTSSLLELSDPGGWMATMLFFPLIARM